jgi:hypothetical protein
VRSHVRARAADEQPRFRRHAAIGGRGHSTSKVRVRTNLTSIEPSKRLIPGGAVTSMSDPGDYAASGRANGPSISTRRPIFNSFERK